MRDRLCDDISVDLLKNGYTVKVLESGSFDILARDESILLIKILSDANSISPEYAQDMKRIASYLRGVPLIIAERAGTELQDNVIYSRQGIKTLNKMTFEKCLRKSYPVIKSTKAGTIASISGKTLKTKREEKGYSLTDLARKLGVSKRMITKYEKGESEITLKKAHKLYDLFGESVFEEIRVFEQTKCTNSSCSTKISKKYLQLGFEASETPKSAFDVIAKKEKDIILTEVGDEAGQYLKPLARLLEVDKLVIYQKKKPKDLPSIKKEEFFEFDDSKELLKFLRRF